MISRYAFRALLPVSLLAAACGPAAAQSAPAAKTMVHSSPINPVGPFSIEELANKGARAPTKPSEKPFAEMPHHRLPNGGLTSAPPKSFLEQLPVIPPNAEVESRSAAPLAMPPNTESGSKSAAPLMMPPDTEADSESARPFRRIKGFIGIHSRDNLTAFGSPRIEFEPPDQGLAVNKNVAAEIVNDVVEVFDARTGAALIGPVALSAFFAPVAPPRDVIGDPQAFFDPTTGRWFFTVEDFTRSKIDIAVSTTSDLLTTTFNFYAIPATFGCCVPDFPKAGYDANGFFISVNLFSRSFSTAGTLVVSKADLEAGVGTPLVQFVYPRDFVVQPSVPTPGEPFENGANGTEYLMEARKLVDGANNIRVWAISNTNNIDAAPGTLRANFVDVVAQPYGRFTVPSTQPNVVGPFCRSVGATTAPLLNGSFAAFTATIPKASGKLYGALAFGARDGAGLPRDVIAWEAVKPSVARNGIPSASIVKQGLIVPRTGYSLLNPAFAFNNSGAGVLGFSITNKSQFVPGGFPSTAFIHFAATGPVGRIFVSGQGVSSADEFVGCLSLNGNGIDRWGDYGAATVDAATGIFYTANENISGPRGVVTNWGTFITRTTIFNALMASPN